MQQVQPDFQGPMVNQVHLDHVVPRASLVPMDFLEDLVKWDSVVLLGLLVLLEALVPLVCQGFLDNQVEMLVLVLLDHKVPQVSNMHLYASLFLWGIFDYNQCHLFGIQ